MASVTFVICFVGFVVKDANCEAVGHRTGRRLGALNEASQKSVKREMGGYYLETVGSGENGSTKVRIICEMTKSRGRNMLAKPL